MIECLLAQTRIVQDGEERDIEDMLPDLYSPLRCTSRLRGAGGSGRGKGKPDRQRSTEGGPSTSQSSTPPSFSNKEMQERFIRLSHDNGLRPETAQAKVLLQSAILKTRAASASNDKVFYETILKAAKAARFAWAAPLPAGPSRKPPPDRRSGV